jgi:alanyl-tRNA synthetase
MKLVNKSRIVDGAQIFKLVDSYGLPLEVITDRLREKGMGFNVVEFIQAALDSKNFTYKTIKPRLLDGFEGDKESMSQLLDGLADKWK